MCNILGHVFSLFCQEQIRERKFFPVIENNCGRCCLLMSV